MGLSVEGMLERSHLTRLCQRKVFQILCLFLSMKVLSVNTIDHHVHVRRG